MPTWGEILRELQASRSPQGQGPDFDGVRAKYLAALHRLTGRAVIYYGTAFLESRPIAPLDLQIYLDDLRGFMECVSNIETRELDLILHSQGGSAEAAESIVEYLRSRFDHVRVFIPLAAMSAATMVSLSANVVVMGQHSQLGPIDPQFIIQTPEGPRQAPARAILKQFEMAKQECQNTANLAAWVPILRSYAPGLLTQCQDSQALAVRMVSEWLRRYMLAGEADYEQKAAAIANWFADYDAFQSHGRRVGPDQAEGIGVKVLRLESDHALQDATLSVHHAAMHTFSNSPAVSKIIENHLGRRWVRLSAQIEVQMQRGPAPPQPPGPRAPTLNRQERRRLERGGR